MGQVAEAKAEKKGDDVNWFGVKIGAEKAAMGAGGGGGVGKYLNLGAGASAPKRPLASVAVSDAPEPPKKRKIGFGSFEGW